MTKVTVNPQTAPQPAGQVVAQAATEVQVPDTRGRVITMRKPNPITRLRFIDAMGESSSNRLWAANVWPLMYVAAIDGQPLPTPSNKSQIEALYQRLDEDGLEVVLAAHEAHFNTEGADVNEDLAKK